MRGLKKKKLKMVGATNKAAAAGGAQKGSGWALLVVAAMASMLIFLTGFGTDTKRNAVVTHHTRGTMIVHMAEH